MALTENKSVKKLYNPRKAIKVKWTLSMVVALFFLFSLISPLLSFAGHGLVTSWSAFLLWFFFALAERKIHWFYLQSEFSARRVELMMLAGWFIVILFNWISGRGYTGFIHILDILTIIMILFMEIVYSSRDDGEYKAIVIAMILLFGFETIRAMPTLYSQSGLSREATIYGMTYAEMQPIYFSSIGDGGYYTSLAIALPVIFAISLREGGFLKYLLISLSILIAISISLATFLGAILLMISGFFLFGLFSIWFTKQKLKWIFIFAMIGGVVLLIWSNYLVNTQQVSIMEKKFTTLSANVLQNGFIKGDTTYRSEYWLMSWNTFLDNPILGIGPSTGQNNLFYRLYVGGHSTWLDIPAQYGLVGMFFYVFFIGAAMNHVLKNSMYERGDILWGARLVVCLIFIIAGSYNPVHLLGPIRPLLFFMVFGRKIENQRIMRSY